VTGDDPVLVAHDDLHVERSQVLEARADLIA
jgi:hypothetical protein